ncbi:reverse transcriptase domain, reverse transcriptase zinc-binding domain protein [Tanacetum coccineum]
MFEGNEDAMTFNLGKSAEEKDEGKKKIGRSVTKAFEVARKTGVKWLGENKKRVSDVYKEYHDVESESIGIFHFGKDKDCEGDSFRCNANMDQVKEIGELIGVSWVRANGEVKEKDHFREGNKENEGMGESGKKGWIRSIIKDECPNCKEAVGDERFIAVKGSWKGKNEDVFFVCIYGPHVGSHKASLWERLSGLMNKWQGVWCIFGDLNVVRRIKDIFNSQVNVREMVEFNGFINNMKLIEIPMGGRKFTRVSDDVALDRKLSDHCPMVIKDVELDFGPKPFRIFNVWMEEPDFISVIEEAWRKDVRSSRPDCVFRDRLKTSRQVLGYEVRRARKQWEEKEREFGNMLRQKARIKWDVEGDENLKFFHSRVRRGNNKCNLRGGTIRPIFCSTKIDKITMEDGWTLERVFSAKEFGKKRKKKGLIFKVDFEKAFDSIKWRFLLDLIGKMGFGGKWCNWVEACLRMTSMSILVNGSPSEVFGLERGVRQGDPLSPFLFIFAAEGLNAIVTEAVKKCIFRGVVVGVNNVTVSHLQYADDTIFFGEWNKENAKSLMCILKCFEEISGLKVNYNKSKLYGIGVDEREMSKMARWMGCGIGEFPFTYLGLPIGENMRRVNSWGAHRKWCWRFRREGGSLWVKVIKSIHGDCGGLDNGRTLGGGSGGSGVWKDIVKIGEEINGVGLEFSSSCIGCWVMGGILGGKKVVCRTRGRGVMTFGVGNGIGLEILSKELVELLGVVQNVVVNYNYRDEWRWQLGDDGEFTVKELTRLIEEKILHVESGGHETLWNNLVPRKVNIFVWRASKGRLPVRVELDRRGIDLDSVLCPCCDNIVETCTHSLVTCDLAMSVWVKIFNCKCECASVPAGIYQFINVLLQLVAAIDSVFQWVSVALKSEYAAVMLLLSSSVGKGLLLCLDIALST